MALAGFFFWWGSFVTCKSLVEEDKTVRIVQIIFSIAMFILASGLIICA